MLLPKKRSHSKILQIVLCTKTRFSLSCLNGPFSGSCFDESAFWKTLFEYHHQLIDLYVLYGNVGMIFWDNYTRQSCSSKMSWFFHPHFLKGNQMKVTIIWSCCMECKNQSHKKAGKWQLENLHLLSCIPESQLFVHFKRLFTREKMGDLWPKTKVSIS